MDTLFGIGLDVWVNIDRDCDMSHEVVGDQAQFTLGHRNGTLQLILDEAGLTQLVDEARKTLGEMRAITR